MKIGKIPESVLKRSVLKQLKKGRKEVLQGPAPGEDCAALCLDEEIVVLSSNPVTERAGGTGIQAVHTAVNNLLAGGAQPVGILVNIFLPEQAKEKELKALMHEVQQTCDELGISVLGGHTQTTEAVNRIIISVTSVGKAQQRQMIKTGGAKPLQDIVMTKYAALEGTGMIAQRKEQELLTRYNKDFILSAQDLTKDRSVWKEAMIAREYDVSAMHDIREGGIYGGLWELAAASQVGLKVDLDAILMRQETVEVCEFFDLNPYKLNAGGSMLIVTPNGRDLVRALQEAEIPAAIIGKTTKEESRIIIREGEEGFLEPPKSDELYKIFTDK